MSLTIREKRFVAEYPVAMNARAAAIRAGYSPGSATKSAYKLLRKPEIAAAIAAIEAPALARAGVTLDRLLCEAAHIAFADIRRALRPDGTLKPLDEIDAATAAALNIEAARSSDGRTYLKIRGHNKIAAMFLLGRHLMLSQDSDGLEAPAGGAPTSGALASGTLSGDALARAAASGDPFAEAMAEARARYS